MLDGKRAAALWGVAHLHGSSAQVAVLLLDLKL